MNNRDTLKGIFEGFLSKKLRSWMGKIMKFWKEKLYYIDKNFDGI